VGQIVNLFAPVGYVGQLGKLRRIGNPPAGSWRAPNLHKRLSRVQRIVNPPASEHVPAPPDSLFAHAMAPWFSARRRVAITTAFFRLPVKACLY
jgi:hypothetical protein